MKSNPTKADLHDELGRTISEFRTFRHDVVAVALKAAKKYGWCEVADDLLRELGLADVMPITYQVEFQGRITGSWHRLTQMRYASVAGARRGKAWKLAGEDKARRIVKVQGDGTIEVVATDLRSERS